MEIQKLQERHTLEKNQAVKGSVDEVLVEGLSKNSRIDIMGRTRTNRIVNFEGETKLIGKKAFVRICDAYIHSLRGELFEKERNWQC